jgi:hypothetical protein
MFLTPFKAVLVGNELNMYVLYPLILYKVASDAMYELIVENLSFFTLKAHQIYLSRSDCSGKNFGELILRHDANELYAASILFHVAVEYAAMIKLFSADKNCVPKKNRINLDTVVLYFQAPLFRISGPD